MVNKRTQRNDWECWALSKVEKWSIKATQKRLTQLVFVTRRDLVRNEYIQLKVGKTVTQTCATEADRSSSQCSNGIYKLKGISYRLSIMRVLVKKQLKMLCVLRYLIWGRTSPSNGRVVCRGGKGRCQVQSRHSVQQGLVVIKWLWNSHSKIPATCTSLSMPAIFELAPMHGSPPYIILANVIQTLMCFGVWSSVSVRHDV
jgi:hypothetical protein